MVEHIHYYQEKTGKGKNGRISTCELKLASDDEKIYYRSRFYDDYLRIHTRNTIVFHHQLIINKQTGDIETLYQIENNGNYKPLKSGTWVKKNDFDKLDDICDRGLYNGEKKVGFWGKRYIKETEKIFNIIKTQLLCNTSNQHMLEKNYDKFEMSPLYDMIVDFHLTKKGIKYHDNVYSHIMSDYPKKKWLKLNDDKFLPAVLDSYGIKSKYLIGELSFDKNKNIDIGCLNYICKLFGDNYIDYIKRFNWQSICRVYFTPKKFHECKNDVEKACVANIISNWNRKEERLENPLESFYEMFNIRAFLEQKGYDLKIKVKTPDDFDLLKQEWLSIRKYLTVGYKLRYDIPQEIIDDIEEPISLDGKIFKPKVLLSEDDYNLEGIKMKNCMSKQFTHGAIFIYVSLSHNKKRINLQYRQGGLVQAYGKANTPVLKEVFDGAVDILTKRLSRHETLTWKREKYELLTK